MNSQRDLKQSHQDRSFFFLMSWRLFHGAFLCDSTEEIYLLSLSSRAGPCSPLIPWTRASWEGTQGRRKLDVLPLITECTYPGYCRKNGFPPSRLEGCSWKQGVGVARDWDPERFLQVVRHVPILLCWSRFPHRRLWIRARVGSPCSCDPESPLCSADER